MDAAKILEALRKADRLRTIAARQEEAAAAYLKAAAQLRQDADALERAARERTNA